MTCELCRGYHVSFCPACDETIDIGELSDMQDLISQSVEKIKSGEITHTDELYDFAIPIVGKISDSDDEYDNFDIFYGTFQELMKQKFIRTLLKR